jgi:glycosyltransferase involved in cell wall biosynthesis
MKRRLCFIINSLKAAGAEKYVLDLASSAAAKGIEAHIIALGPIDEEFLRKYDLTNVTITQYASGKMISLNTLLTIYRIYRLMRRRRFMLVHVNMRTPDIIGGIAAILSHTRFTSTQHDTQPWRYSRRINDVSKKYIHRFIMRHALAIIAPSESVRQYLYETEKIPHRKVFVIYHGIELERFRVSIKKPGKKIHIGTLGRFRPEKGQRYIIESIPLVLKRLAKRDVEVHFAGDGPSLGDARAQTMNLGVNEKIKFLGSVYDVPRFLERMDMIVHAAVSGEAFCFAALEGLAAGKAVIATNTDGLPEYITNYHNGILVPIRSPDSIADAVVQLAKDPEMYLRICRNAAKSCRPFFSRERMIKQTFELYEAMIGHGKN